MGTKIGMGNLTAGIMDGRKREIGTGDIEVLIGMGIAGIAALGIERGDKLKIGSRIKSMVMIGETGKGIGIDEGTEIETEIVAGKLQGAIGTTPQQAQEDLHRLHRNCDEIMRMLLHPNVLSMCNPRHLPETFTTDQGIHLARIVAKTTVMDREKDAVLCRIENTHLVQTSSPIPTQMPL